MRRGRPPIALALAFSAAPLAGCGGRAPQGPSATTPAEAPPAPHPDDGKGRLALSGPSSVACGSLQSYELVYTAAGRGIATGGGVLLQVSPFFGWSEPQSAAPGAPGFTSVSTTADADVTLEIRPLHQAIARVGRGQVRAGETIVFRYGPARTDTFAERDERFYAKVDGDGDAFFAPLADYPRLAVGAGAVARLLPTLASTPREDGSYRLTVAALDAADNRVEGFAGEVLLHPPTGIDGLPARYGFHAADAGAHTFTLTRPGGVGTFRIEVEDAATGRRYPSNLALPERLPGAADLLWGDLHGHSNLSDGTGTVEDYYRYARDVSALDVAVLTDHDAHGLWAIDERPELWELIRRASRERYAPGAFVTLPAYEWTSWTWGHKHVLYGSEDAAPLLSMRAPATDSPSELWAALAGTDALTISHHPGGGPVPADWSQHDPRLEPVVEITSIHGSSEAFGVPRMIYQPVQGRFVADALARGYRLGFVGSGDTHNGHPGQGDPAAPTSGLAGILATARTREAVLEALRARRTFATSGPRIVVMFWLEEHLMGSEIELKAGGPAAYRSRVWAQDRIEKVEIVRDGQVVAEARPGTTEASVEGTDPSVPRGRGYYYLRVTQWNEEQAWSSPVFYDAS